MAQQVMIAVAGGPGSGKSTFAHLLTVALGDERHVNPPVPDGMVAEYARTFIDRRIRSERLPGGKKRLINVYDQKWILEGQLRREQDLADYPVVISDCPAFLPYVYFFEVDQLEEIIGDETRDLIRRELERAAHKAVKRYSVIFFLPPAIPFRQDPTRWQAEDRKRKYTSDRIEAFLKLAGVPYIMLKKRSRQGRVREALPYIIPLLNEIGKKNAAAH